MEENGDFSRLKPNWKTQSRLESSLLKFCSQTFGHEPGPTQLRAHPSGRPPSFADAIAGQFDTKPPFGP